jgi:hypothetical protein
MLLRLLHPGIGRCRAIAPTESFQEIQQEPGLS